MYKDKNGVVKEAYKQHKTRQQQNEAITYLV